MKKIISYVITAAVIASCISSYAEGLESIDSLPPEQAEVSLVPEEEISEYTESVIGETELIETEPENEDAVEALSDDITLEVKEEYTGKYRHGEIYDKALPFKTTKEIDVLTATEVDYTETLTDEALLAESVEDTESEANVTGWETCASMSSARSNMSSIVINDNIYTFGGTESGEVTNKTEVFDTTTEIWTRKASMPEGRYKHSAVYMNGKVYICGGYNEDGTAASDIEIYDVANNTWEINTLATPNNNTNYIAGVYDEELYIFGGRENGQLTTKVYKYSYTLNEWNQMSCSMPVSNSVDGKAATTSYGFYILSGTNVIKYSYEDNTVTKVDTLPRTIMDYAFMTRDYMGKYSYSDYDCLIVSGGREYASGISLANVKVRGNADYVYSEDWEPEWYNDLRLIRGLSCHNMVEANGYMYVFGGQITPDQEQRLMFRRSIAEWHDDYADNEVFDLMNDYAYGSINYCGDHDDFRFTPTISGKYEIKQLGAIQSNNMGYRYYVEIKDDNKSIIGDLPEYVGGIPMEANKTYIISVSDSSAIWTGNYFFKVNMVYDDAPDIIDNAIHMPIETTVYKTFLGELDIDCMYFDIPETGMYSIETLVNGNTNAHIVIQDEKKETDQETQRRILYEYDHTGSNVKETRLKKGKYYISLSTKSYDPENPAYTVKISNTAIYEQMNKARYRHGLISASGKLYAVGGLNSDYNIETVIEAYTPLTGMWNKVADSENTLRQGTSAIAYGSKIYLVGGIDDYSHGAMKYYPLDDSIMIYDTESNEWTSTGDLGIDRERTGLAVKDGNIYIAGGRTYLSTKYSDKIEVFNTETDTLTNYSVSLPTGIVDPQIFFANDVLYVVGGIDRNGFSDKVYALENGVWTQKASMPYASCYMRGKAINNDFCCAAVNASGDVDILKYDSDSDEWTTINSGFIKDRSYYAVEAHNGMLYISGGYSYIEDAVKNDIYTIDAMTDVSAIDTAIPVRTIGFEYEQMVESNMINSPKITGVNAKVVDREKGIYDLYLTDSNYEHSAISNPFFFWSAREGVFIALSDDYRKVRFYADKGTGHRQVKVIVGIGDGRGYVDKKAFLLDGNSETE